MRLILNQKEKIHAWILWDTHIDFALFSHILPTLGFPPIYATRETLLRLRESLASSDCIQSCRFFELFPDGVNNRTIGNFHILHGQNGIRISSQETEISLYEPTHPQKNTSSTHSLQSSEN
jgi:hypothetical protein